PVRRGRVPFTDAPLPEDVHPPLPARARAKRERDEPERLPEIIRLDVLRAPAAEELAPIRRALEHRLDEHRADERPLFLRQDVHLIDHPDIIMLEILIVPDAISKWHGFATRVFGRHGLKTHATFFSNQHLPRVDLPLQRRG